MAGETENTQPDGGNTGDPTPDQSGGGGDEAQTLQMTQEELDALIGQRAQRAQRSAKSELLDELGFEDLDQVRGVITAYQEAQQAEMSELERAQQQIDELRQQNREIAAQAEQRLIRSEVTATASRLGFRNPGDAFALANLSGVTVEDGNVVGVDEVLEALLEERPYLKESKRQPPDLDAERGGGDGDGGGRPVTEHLLPPALRSRVSRKQ